MCLENGSPDRKIVRLLAGKEIVVICGDEKTHLMIERTASENLETFENVSQTQNNKKKIIHV